MSVAQIKQVLDGITAGKSSESVKNLAMMLYFRWAQVDPREAVTAAAMEEEGTSGSVSEPSVALAERLHRLVPAKSRSSFPLGTNIVLTPLRMERP